jgi:hypothetical protein
MCWREGPQMVVIVVVIDNKYKVRFGSQSHPKKNSICITFH